MSYLSEICKQVLDVTGVSVGLPTILYTEMG